MLKFYGYKKCDTCRKAEKFLQEAGIGYEFVDIPFMNKSLLALILFILSAFYANAQDAILKGTITDAVTGETLIQANIKSGEQGTVSEYDGKYQFELSSGNQEIVVSYIGYKPQTITANLSPGNNTLNFALEEDNVMMQEINVVADVARSRETPVAFSTVPIGAHQRGTKYTRFTDGIKQHPRCLCDTARRRGWRCANHH